MVSGNMVTGNIYRVCFALVRFLTTIGLALFLPGASFAQTSEVREHAKHRVTAEHEKIQKEYRPTVKANLTLDKQYSDDEETDVLTSTVTSQDGRPIPDVTVSFDIPRLFGILSLGEGRTDTKGVAFIHFPEEFPGDANTGMLQITAKIVKSNTYQGSISQTFEGGTKLAEVVDPFPRALWSPRTDWYILATLPLLICIVWSVYLFALYQLKKVFTARPDKIES